MAPATTDTKEAPVSTPTLIGVPAPRGAYTARWLHWGDHPDTLVPLLRRIWVETFARDTAAMAAALLAHDWSDLAVNPRRRRGDRQRPVPGSATPPRPATARPGTAGSARTSTASWNGCT